MIQRMIVGVSVLPSAIHQIRQRQRASWKSIEGSYTFHCSNVCFGVGLRQNSISITKLLKMPLIKGKGKESRSRVGTPLATDSGDAMQGVQTTDEAEASYSDILDRYCRSAHPPPSVQLQKIRHALNACREVAKEQSDKHDKGMRETMQKRKQVMELAREQEIEEANAEAERKAQTKKQAEQEAKARPPAVGARGLAPQDGTHHESKPFVHSY